MRYRLTSIVAAAATLAALIQPALTAQPAGRPGSSPFIVPQPERVAPGSGAFAIDADTRIVVSDRSDPELLALAEQTASMLLGSVGIQVPILGADAAAALEHAIMLRLADPEAQSNREGYALEVTDQGIAITASDHAGLFYGMQTLRQLLPPPSGGPPWRVGAVSILDQPRFPYRGMHLDVGRHFFPVAFVKLYIDLMAMYKLNTFHWHLTEDQGWRIEIEKYPRLTEVGSIRKETILERNFDPYVGDGIPHGGFYTQDEIRDVVEYARARYVTVIPEIEMPGHSTAALAAYPELGCTPGPFEVATTWGVHDDIYCPTETTFTFLEDVLTEVMALFPSPYIHVGGDEVPKRRWQESEAAQAVMRREGLANEEELQSYFIKRIEAFLIAHGRRLIGWDEILEGGLAPEATVMSWRGIAGGIEAARQGHDVIMTPTSHLYFDYYQGDRRLEPLAIGGFTPLERVYEFEPIPDELTAEQASHVLGAQGNVWTEYMQTPSQVEYMILPRMLALAEVVWSPKDARDFDWFTRRLPAQFRALDAMGVIYRVPDGGGSER